MEASNVPATKPSEAPAAPEGEEKSESRLGWWMGWVVGPGLLISGIFVAGVVLGANRPDGWYASATLWLFG